MCVCLLLGVSVGFGCWVGFVWGCRFGGWIWWFGGDCGLIVVACGLGVWVYLVPLRFLVVVA